MSMEGLPYYNCSCPMCDTARKMIKYKEITKKINTVDAIPPPIPVKVVEKYPEGLDALLYQVGADLIRYKDLLKQVADTTLSRYEKYQAEARQIGVDERIVLIDDMLEKIQKCQT